MKFTVILALGLAATALASPNIPALRSRRQAAITTASPGGCTISTSGGLAGVLTQVGNLLGNLLDNLGPVLASDGSVQKLLSDLLVQVQRLLNDLLGSNLSDDQANEREGLLATLIGDIVNLLNQVLGNGAATSWPCTRPTGVIGSLLASVIGTVNGLTGSWSHDGGLLSGLLNLILRLVTALLALLL